MKVAILDDYQRVALSYAAWPQDLDITVYDVPMPVSALGAFDVICTMRERTAFDAAAFAQLPRLRLLTTTGMRNASIDMEAARAHDVVVTGTEGKEATTSTVEHIWAMMLAAVRYLPHQHNTTKAGGWQTLVPMGLAGRTMGVVGLGRLGQEVANLARAFHMEVVAWSPHLTHERAKEAGVRLVTREEVFMADIVTLQLVLSPLTRGLIGRADLQRMKPTAFFVNTSRAGLVEEEALLELLQPGRIAGAALDVFSAEPLPADSPLRRMGDRVVLSPHLGYVADTSYETFYAQTVDSILAWQAGKAVRVLT